MNKVVVVTGVSCGLGRAFATALLQSGFVVVGTVRKQEAVGEFEQLQPGSAFARVLDVTDIPERLAAVMEEVEANVGPIYALINNAGHGHEGTLLGQATQGITVVSHADCHLASSSGAEK